MPIERIGKFRESLTVNSEEYKKRFVKYLQARDYYSVKASSDVESTFADIILTRKCEQREYWVEIKATKISLHNSNFLKQFGQYFAEYLRRTPERRFKFILACYEIIDPEYFEEIFTELNSESITTLVRKICAVSSSEIKSTIEKYDIKDWMAFFEESIVKEADFQALEVGKAKIKPKAPLKPTIREADYSAVVVRNFGDVSPLNEPDKLFLNLFEVNLPQKIFMAKTPFSSAQELFTETQLSFPPFDLTEKKIFTFNPFETSNPLNDFTLHGTIEEFDVNTFLHDEKKHTIVKKIINRWINSQCRQLRLRRDDRTLAYYYPRNFMDDGVITASWKPNQKKSTRELTRPMKKEEKIFFWVHKAANIFVTYFNQKFYLQIRPRFLFSLDGLEIMDGVKADSKDRFFRKSNYNRNLNQLYDVRFWASHVFPESKNPDMIKLSKFTTEKQKETIRIGQQLSVDCSYKPNIDTRTEIEEFDIIESNTEELIRLDSYFESD